MHTQVGTSAYTQAQLLAAHPGDSPTPFLPRVHPEGIFTLEKHTGPKALPAQRDNKTTPDANGTEPEGGGEQSWQQEEVPVQGRYGNGLTGRGHGTRLGVRPEARHKVGKFRFGQCWECS